MSDIREALDRIKARTEEQPDDSGSAVELSELLDVARDDSLRLAEALGLLLNLAEELDKMARRIEINLPNFGADNRAKAEAFRESAGAIRRIIEAKLTEEEA